MSYFRLLVVLAIMAIVNSCSQQQAALPERPHAAVFRSVLDAQPRMLTVALHDDMWLAYSATGAGESMERKRQF
ncbi:MAG: hypothetical protein R2795_21070 [Saprospiraceae bacterium]